jgi:hypothetical protein
MSGPVWVGGFEEGEFEGDGPLEKVPAQILLRGADAVQLGAQEIDEAAKPRIVRRAAGHEPSCGYGSAGTDRRTGKRGSRGGAGRGPWHAARKMGRPPKLTPHQQKEAIKRRDQGDETLADIGRSYNVSPATIHD